MLDYYYRRGIYGTSSFMMILRGASGSGGFTHVIICIGLG
jgi:hypothetical protein